MGRLRVLPFLAWWLTGESNRAGHGCTTIRKSHWNIRKDLQKQTEWGWSQDFFRDTMGVGTESRGESSCQWIHISSKWPRTSWSPAAAGVGAGGQHGLVMLIPCWRRLLQDALCRASSKSYRHSSDNVVIKKKMHRGDCSSLGIGKTQLGHWLKSS